MTSKYEHPASTDKRCLHCEILAFIQREFPKIDDIELTQKLVEVMVDVIRWRCWGNPQAHEMALREVQEDLEHCLQTVAPFTTAAKQ